MKKEDAIALEREHLESVFTNFRPKHPSSGSFFGFVADEKSPVGYSVFNNDSKQNKTTALLPAGFYTVVKTIHGHFLALRSETNKTQHGACFTKANIKSENATKIVEMAGEIYVDQQGVILLFLPRSGSFHKQMNRIYHIDSSQNQLQRAQQYLEKSKLPAVATLADYKAFGDSAATPENNLMWDTVNYFFEINGNMKIILPGIVSITKQHDKHKENPTSLSQALTETHIYVDQKQFQHLKSNVSLLFLSCIAERYKLYCENQQIDAITITLKQTTPTATNTTVTNSPPPMTLFTSAAIQAPSSSSAQVDVKTTNTAIKS